MGKVHCHGMPVAHSARFKMPFAHARACSMRSKRRYAHATVFLARADLQHRRVCGLPLRQAA